MSSTALTLDETISTLAKLQAAEARAVAAVTVLKQITEVRWACENGQAVMWQLATDALDHPDLAAARELIRKAAEADTLRTRLQESEALASQWQPWPPNDSETNECLAWRDDAGIFPVQCVYDEGTGNPTWFVWGGIDDLTGDLPALYHPMPKAPEKGGTR